MRALIPFALSIVFVPAAATAQSSPWALQWNGADVTHPEALLSLDHDDDNDDGVPDLAELPAPDPAVDDEVARLTVRGVTAGAVRVTATGGVRLVTREGTATESLVPVLNGAAEVRLLGVTASRAPRDASVTLSAGSVTRRLEITVGAAALLRGDNGVLYGNRDAVGVSHEITTSASLPRSATWSAASDDPDNVRVELWDPGSALSGRARVEALGTAVSVGVRPGGLRAQVSDLPLARPDTDGPMRSRFLRLVGDDLDVRAPGVQGQTLLVGLRDRVRVRYQRVDTVGELTTDLRVGRPGNEDGVLAARRARWRLVVLRHRAAGPVVGNDEAGALAIARRQVEISNEVYLQCAVTWGDPTTARIDIVEPVRDALLSVGDNDGLSAAGGTARFLVNNVAVGPVRVLPGWRPVDTARALATAVRAAGFTPRVTTNARTDYGAFGSADLTALDRAGRPVSFAAIGGAPIATDARQTITVGRVDLGDGVDEFNNLNSASGTLEERSLIKPLTDGDPATIDLFLINRFARGTRIGEAFVEGAAGAIFNGLLVDRAGISAEREAWTQSHEAGHILLDQPWHPDNTGPDRPWLLMDADASLGAVTGPKRLSVEECARIHQQSGVDAVPSVLTRFDPARVSPRAREFVRWPAESLYPRPVRVDAVAAGTEPAASVRPRAEDPTEGELGLTVTE